MKKRVFVGLSGGVDSAVSVALLKEAGYDVTGVFIKIWQPEFTECSWREDRLDAMRVAAHLGVPFREIDFSEEYKNEVVVGMIEDYERGITPNPDVLCNRSIKFGHFAKWAFERGADKIATGHYARISDKNHNDIVSRYELHRGIDTSKDQSYFLYRLGESDLARTIFPIGAYKKAEVRSIARRFRLPIAEKHDSQGLCFVGDVSIPEFLSRYIELKKGPVLDEEGGEIGEHDGAALYTIGQRHGFFVRNSSAPHYVVSIDTEQNSVVVSQTRDGGKKKYVVIQDVHWIREPLEASFRAEAEARYREQAAPVQVRLEGERAEVTFDAPHLLAPGQSLVLYEGERVLGGGVIQNVR